MAAVLMVCFGICLNSAFGAPKVSAQTQLPTKGSFHDRIGSMWSSDKELFVTRGGQAQTRTQAMLLRIMVRAIDQGEQSLFNDPIRARRLVDVLTKYPSFIDGKRTPWRPNSADQSHLPGFFGSAIGDASGQHVSIDAAASIALGEAYQARVPLGLNDVQSRNIQRAVINTSSHGLFQPTHIRAGQLIWTADMLWAKYLVDGSSMGEFVRDYRRALDSMRPIFQKMLTIDGGFRYNWKYPEKSTNRLNSPEYSAISAAGLQYLSRARRHGLKITSTEHSLYRRWLKQIIWGAFANSGMLNWDTGLGAQRRYISQYWGWTMLTTQSLFGTGLLTASEIHRVAAICKAGQERFKDLTAIDNGYLARTLYGTANTFIDPSADRSMATVRAYLALRVCPDAVAKASAARSFDRTQTRFAATTDRYATSIVKWNRDAAYGALPTKLLDGHGNAIAGLGSWGTRFELEAGGIRFGNGRASGQKFIYSAVPGSGPMTARNNSLKVGITRGTRNGSLNYRFMEDGFSVNGRTSSATERTWRIPIASGSAVTINNSGGKAVANVVPSKGAPWVVTVPETAKAVFTVDVSRNRFDPTVNKMLVIRLPKGTALKMWINISALATP